MQAGGAVRACEIGNAARILGLRVMHPTNGGLRHLSDTVLGTLVVWKLEQVCLHCSLVVLRNWREKEREKRVSWDSSTVEGSR